MAPGAPAQEELLWAHDVGTPIVHLAASSEAGWVAVAGADRQVTVLDEGGEPAGRFKAGSDLRGVCTDAAGRIFTALGGESIIYGFGRQGQMDWRVEMGWPISGFAVSADGSLIGGASQKGWLCLYLPESREQRLVPGGGPISHVALAAGDPPVLVVCGEGGRLARLNLDGKPRWRHKLGPEVGSLHVRPDRGIVAAAVGTGGLRLFDLDGVELGTLQVLDAVPRADVSPDGTRIMVETEGGRFALMDRESHVHWEGEFPQPPAAWALARSGTVLVTALAEGQVSARQVAEPSARKPAPARPTAPKPAEAGRRPAAAAPAPQEAPRPEDEALDWPEHFDIADVMAQRPQRSHDVVAARCRVAWKKGLPVTSPALVPDLFRMSTDGRFLVAGLSDGTVMVLDAAGERVLHEHLEPPLRLAPRAMDGQVVIRSAGDIVVAEPAARRLRRVKLDLGSVRHLDCPLSADRLCTLDPAGVLRAFDLEGRELWRRAVKGEPTDLLVSPDGRTILVPCADGRFRYYDEQGSMARKFRFAEPDGHRALAQGDDLSVFVAPGGHMTVTDGAGAELWSRALFVDVLEVEVLGAALAVYGPGGACAVVYPREGTVWELHPPPGRVRLRAPLGADPVLLHAGGRAVTAFRGYRRKLEVAWRHECAGPVRLLDAAWNGRSVAAALEHKIIRIESSTVL